MANRFSDWQEDLSLDLIKSKKRRNLFFDELRQEYSNDLEALRAFVKIIGLKEYSKVCELPSSNISNYLKEGKDLKISTLTKLLSPLGVKSISIDLGDAA
jgi:predicted transcriptional regulator